MRTHLPFELSHKDGLVTLDKPEVFLQRHDAFLAVTQGKFATGEMQNFVAYRVDGDWRYKVVEDVEAGTDEYKRLIEKRAEQAEEYDNPIFQRGEEYERTTS